MTTELTKGARVDLRDAVRAVLGRVARGSLDRGRSERTPTLPALPPCVCRVQGGRCPIHYAVEVADSGPALVDLLVARGASPGVEDSFGRTPVHLAATTKNVSVLRALLAQGSRELLLARDVVREERGGAGGLSSTTH